MFLGNWPQLNLYSLSLIIIILLFVSEKGSRGGALILAPHTGFTSLDLTNKIWAFNPAFFSRQLMPHSEHHQSNSTTTKAGVGILREFCGIQILVDEGRG